MDLKEEEYLMVNVPLWKYVGLYQKLIPHTQKIFRISTLTFFAAIQMMNVIISCIWELLNIYYFMGDFTVVAQYLILTVSGITSTFKHCYIIRYSDILWNCIHSTSINLLSYKYHKRQILEIGKKKSELYSKLFVILWLILFGAWIFSPLFLNNYFMDINIKPDVYHYRFNVINLNWPASDRFYNENFMIYYITETSMILSGGQGILIFDVILISMCIVFSYQLKTVADSYSTLGTSYNILMNSSNKIKMDEFDDSMIMYDFKALLQDQQCVIENLKNFYKILQPVTLVQIFGDTLVTILVTSAMIKNYFDGLLAFNRNSKLILTFVLHIMHLYITCYILTDVNLQKDSLNFALYSCDWTGKSMRFKKLLLYSMRMNSSIEYLNVHISKHRIVNIEMFTDIMRTTYSVTSVLVKRFSRNL